MKIPKKVKLAGYEISVESADNVNDGEQLLYGKYENNKKKIYLSTNIIENEFLREETFIHELLHAIDLTFDLEMGEKRINTFSVALHSILKQNTGIFNEK